MEDTCLHSIPVFVIGSSASEVIDACSGKKVTFIGCVNKHSAFVGCATEGFDGGDAHSSDADRIGPASGRDERGS